MHQIEFDVNEHRNGSIDVRFTWTHDVGLPNESVIKNQYRHYTSIRDIALEVVYFLNIEENYGEEVCEELTNALVEMPAHAVKLLSYMVIDLWSETQIEYKRRKISNRRRFGDLSSAIRKTLREFCEKHPNLTYGEALSALEKEHNALNSGAHTEVPLSDTLRRTVLRPKVAKRKRPIKPH